jgi:hypothetical protein
MSDKITELHVWLYINPEGAESMLSADLPGPDGVRRHMPLMSSKYMVASGEKMRAVVNRTMGETPGVAELRTFYVKA